MRFLQGVSIEHTWLAGEMGRDVDMNDTELSATFAVPIFPNREHPFSFRRVSGCTCGTGRKRGGGPGRPPVQVYDAYVDFTWRPRFNELLSAELAFRPGLYTDFEAAGSDSLRLQGRGWLS